MHFRPGSESRKERKFKMFCPKCGAQNPDGAKFCGSCGAAISANAPAHATATPATPPLGSSEA